MGFLDLGCLPKYMKLLVCCCLLVWPSYPISCGEIPYFISYEEIIFCSLSAPCEWMHRDYAARDVAKLVSGHVGLPLYHITSRLIGYIIVYLQH